MAAEVAIRITADGKAVVAAAGQASQALQGIGTQAEKTAASLKTTTQASAGLDAAMQKMGKPGQSGGLQSYVADLDRTTISAKQTAAALRGVPAQFTDIVTSLQGGQAPLTVFLQQGGQLKDMFGGAGNAAKALGGYVMGLVNPFTVGAALVGGLAFAYEQGAKESRAFQNAATMSGNAVGLSASQFGAMTQSLSEMAGTRGKAAEALTEIASTGKLAGSEIKNIAEAAILMEKATGQAVGDTVAQFVKLADEPVKASLALNEQYNYLTVAVYEQIKALEEQGNKLGAAELAEKTYADALKARASTVIDNAGLMERAWGGITGAAKRAWDAMLGVGRQATLAEKLAAVGKEIAKAQGPITSSAFGNDGKAAARGYLEENLALQASLQEMVRLEKRGTEATAERAQANAAGVAAVDAITKANDKYANKQGQLNKALDDYRTELGQIKASNPGSELLNADTIARTEAGIRKAYKETATTKVDENAKLIASVRQSVAATAAELEQDQKLTPVQKIIAKLYEEIANSQTRYTLVTLLNVDAITQQALADEAANMTREAGRKALEEANKERQKYLDSTLKDTASLQDQINKQLDHNATLGLSKEAIAALSAQRELDKASTLEALAIKELDRNLDYQQYDATMAKVQAMRELAGAQKTGGTLETLDDEAKKATAEWKKFTGDIERGLTDSLMRGFEAGKGFFKSFWDGIKNLFKTTVLKLAVQGVVTGLTGTAANAATGSAGSGLLGMASNASSLYSGVSGMVTLGSQVVAGTMSVANALGTVAANATGTGISGLLAANGAYGTAAAGSASAAAGSATAVLAAIPGWGWAAMAAIAVAGIFGGRGDKQATGGGIEGNFGSSGFNGNSFSTWQQDGGWFHNDRSGKETDALDAATSKQFSDGYKAVQSAASQAATALGLSADAVTSYSERISVQLGSDTAANEKAIAKVFGDLGDHIATAVAPGLSALAKEGETAGATLSRLAGSLTAVNAWLGVMDQNLLAVSLSGANAASQLADAFGGLDKLGVAVQSYYDNFYNEEEKRVQTIKSINTITAGSGLGAATATRDSFRQLVDAQDLTTESGRKTYAALVGVSGAFASLTPLVAEFVDALGQSVSALTTDALTAVDKQISASQDAASQARSTAVAYHDAAASMRQAGLEIFQTTLTADTSRAYLSQKFAATQALAKGGDKAAMGELGSTAGAYLQAVMAQAATRTEYNIAAALTRRQIEEAADAADHLGNVADYQARLYDVNTSILGVLKDGLSNDTLSLQALNQMSGALGTVGTMLQHSTDIQAQGVSLAEIVAAATGDSKALMDSVLGQLADSGLDAKALIDAVMGGNDLLAGQISRLIGAITGQQDAEAVSLTQSQAAAARNRQIYALQDKGAAFISGLQSAPSTMAAGQTSDALWEKIIASEVAIHLDKFGKDWNTNTTTNAERAGQLEKMQGMYRDTMLAQNAPQIEALRQQVRDLGSVPAFASGGYHAGGLRLVGERGPELEVTGPSRIFSAGQTRSMLGGGSTDNTDLVNELRALRQEVQGLRDEARATALHSAKTSRILARVTRDGEALQTVVAA